MALLPVVVGKDNPILLAKSSPVTGVTKEITKLIRDMKDTLTDENGLGLAAPQVGVNIRMVLVALQKGKKVSKNHTVIVMINPHILSFSEDKEVMEEGCLSLPKLFLPVERSRGITVSFTDEKGKDHVLMLEDMNARIVQHEVDHLDGVLITERYAQIQGEIDKYEN